MSNSEDEIDLSEAIQNSMDSISDIVAMEYDGVVGSLPEWVPDSFQDEFINLRGSLMMDYSLDDIRRFLKAYTDSTYNSDGSCRTGFRAVKFYPIEIEHGLEYLRHLKYCVQQGKNNGLELLAGIDAKYANKGRELSCNQSSGGKSRSEFFKLKKERFLDVAARILANRKRNIPSNRQLARLAVDELYPELCEEEAIKKADSYRHWL